MPNLAGFADFTTALAGAMREYRNRNSPQSRFAENLQAAKAWLDVYGEKQKAELESAQAQEATMKARTEGLLAPYKIAGAESELRKTDAEISRIGAEKEQTNLENTNMAKEAQRLSQPIAPEILQRYGPDHPEILTTVKTVGDYEKWLKQQESVSTMQTSQSKVDWYKWLRGSKFVNPETILGMRANDPQLDDILKDVPNPTLGDVASAANQIKVQAVREKDKTAKEVNEVRIQNLKAETAITLQKLKDLKDGKIPADNPTKALAGLKYDQVIRDTQRLIALGIDPVVATGMALEKPSMESLNKTISEIKLKLPEMDPDEPATKEFVEELKSLTTQKGIFYPIPKSLEMKATKPSEKVIVQLSIWNNLASDELRERYREKWISDGKRVVEFHDENNSLIKTVDLQSLTPKQEKASTMPNQKATTPVKPLTQQSSQKSSVLTAEQKRKIAESVKNE
jgi:hypothetical protein